jgi:hypothetical protein
MTKQTDNREEIRMYQLNSFDLWHQRRDELLREVEGERLARGLRATRPKWTARIRSTLPDGVRARVADTAR